MAISDEPFPPSVKEMMQRDAIRFGREMEPEDLERVLLMSDNDTRTQVLRKLDDADDGNMRQQANLRSLKRRLGEVHSRMQKAGR